MPDAIRVAMWSGPRNISTALMRSFGTRPDTAVVDEPFYAAYLARSGSGHPLRAEVLASQPNDWREVVVALLGPVPGGKPIYYQKLMTHHMLDSFGREWIGGVRNAFLIRDPQAVLSSYIRIRERGEVTLADLGYAQQRELFERVADRLGAAPPVIEGADVLADPGRMLALLCAALEIPYTEAMLSWPSGRRDTDGVWAPAWYASVERSTGFAPPAPPAPPAAVTLPDPLLRIAEQARPHYEMLAAHRLGQGIV
jgi:Sulfotransferase domain